MGRGGGLRLRRAVDRRRVAVRREPAAGRMSAIVEFRKVTYRIGGREILRDLSLRIEPGETLVLLGRSGSGKTTALKMVNGLLFPTAGEVLVEGKPTTAWDPVRLRRRIGYVIQDVGLFPHFTVAQNVGLVPRLEGWDEPKIRARVASCWRQVDLDSGAVCRSLSTRAFRRPAAARGRGARAGGRSADAAVRRAVRRARSGDAPGTAAAVPGAAREVRTRPPSSSRTTCAKRCCWPRASDCCRMERWSWWPRPRSSASAARRKREAFLAVLQEADEDGR